ncbi:MAG: hypothetical protein ACR2MI_03785 [Flavobacteriaceae bacterium]
MRNYIFIALLLSLFSEIIYCQSSETIVSVVNVFLIRNEHPTSYKHINFPKANLIIKRGGIFNYSSIKGAKLVVTELKKRKMIYGLLPLNWQMVNCFLTVITI